MSLLTPMFGGGSVIPPGITDTPVSLPTGGFKGFSLTDTGPLFPDDPLRGFTLTKDISNGVRGNIDTGVNKGLFSGFGKFAQDNFQRLVGAGVDRLGSDLLNFTNKSVDRIERNSFGSLKNQDPVKLARRRARAVKKRESVSRRNMLLVVGAVAALAGGLLLFRR